MFESVSEIDPFVTFTSSEIFDQATPKQRILILQVTGQIQTVKMIIMIMIIDFWYSWQIEDTSVILFIFNRSDLKTTSWSYVKVDWREQTDRLLIICSVCSWIHQYIWKHWSAVSGQTVEKQTKDFIQLNTQIQTH